MKTAYLTGSFALSIAVNIIAAVMIANLVNASKIRSFPSNGGEIEGQATVAAGCKVGDLAFHWEQLESTNYLSYIANLRKIGCPEQTLDDIIVAEITRLYAAKMTVAQRRLAPKSHYWERQRGWPPQLRIEQATLFREKNAVLKELIGLDVDEYNRKSFGATDDSDGPLTFLSAGKQEAFKALQKKYGELKAEMQANCRGLVTEEDRVALSAIDQQEAAETDALLTPEEKLEYGLRNSPTAAGMRQKLDSFHPSEAEFRAIYQAQIAFDKQSQASQDTNASGVKIDPEEEFTNQLKSALGDQRFADYQLSKDPGYQLLVRITDRFEMPQDVATQVLDLKKDAERQVQEVNDQTNLDISGKRVLLQTVHDQTAASLSAVLGEKAFSVYHDYGGSWIDRIGN